MTHIYLMTRGVFHQVQLWQSLMQGQVFDWHREEADTGKKFVSGVGGALRPIQFWEYVVPNESVEDVMNNLKMTPWSKEARGRNLREKAMVLAMRKAFGAKPFPAYTPKPITRLMQVDGVAVQPIGIKEDARGILYDPMLGKKIKQELI